MLGCAKNSRAEISLPVITTMFGCLVSSNWADDGFVWNYKKIVLRAVGSMIVLRAVGRSMMRKYYIFVCNIACCILWWVGYNIIFTISSENVKVSLSIYMF